MGRTTVGRRAQELKRELLRPTMKLPDNRAASYEQHVLHGRRSDYGERRRSMFLPLCIALVLGALSTMIPVSGTFSLQGTLTANAEAVAAGKDVAPVLEGAGSNAAPVLEGARDAAPAREGARGVAPVLEGARNVVPVPESAAGVAPAPKGAVGVAPAPKGAVGVAPAPEGAAGVAPAPKGAVGVAPAPKGAVGVAPAPEGAVGRALVFAEPAECPWVQLDEPSIVTIDVPGQSDLLLSASILSITAQARAPSAHDNAPRCRVELALLPESDEEAAVLRGLPLGAATRADFPTTRSWPGAFMAQLPTDSRQAIDKAAAGAQGLQRWVRQLYRTYVAPRLHGPDGSQKPGPVQSR